MTVGEFADDENMIAKMLIDTVFVICVVAGTMLGMRRCHDLGKPGWFIGLTYIPVVGVLVSLYIWFTPGTIGTNPYGADPLSMDVRR